METTIPISFSELMVRATPGPFRTSPGTEAHHVRGKNGIYVAKAITAKTITDDTQTAADAERITRLLNFAHAGGVDALRQALSCIAGDIARSQSNDEYEYVRKLFADLSNLISILDGQINASTD